MLTLTLLCRIVDNLGDAGVALRLARHWLHHRPNDCIKLCTDDPKPFLKLMGIDPTSLSVAVSPTRSSTRHLAQQVCDNNNPPSTNAINDTAALALAPRLELFPTLDPASESNWGDVIIEMFGTPLPPHRKLQLAQRAPRPVWINLEYLTAENWIADCHGKWSTDPQTGWSQLFFFPGFDHQSGGLLGPEPAANTGSVTSIVTDAQEPPIATPLAKPLKAFVFAYSLQALCTWLQDRPVSSITQQPARNAEIDKSTAVRFHVATASNAFVDHPQVTPLPFVRQTDFDDLLTQHDLLFVRGEDSFVRAQWAGKPLIWQIYPTEDGAHWVKLCAFFERYASDLEDEARQALWQAWLFWNQHPDFVNANGASSSHPSRILQNLVLHWSTLFQHAQRWRDSLMEHGQLIGRLEKAIQMAQAIQQTEATQIEHPPPA